MVWEYGIALVKLAIFVQNATDLPVYPRMVFGRSMTGDDVCLTYES